MAATKEKVLTDKCQHLSGDASGKKTPARQLVVAAVTVILLFIGIVLSAGLGQLPIGPAQVIGSVLQMVGLDNVAAPENRLIEQTLWQIRFPEWSCHYAWVLPWPLPVV